MNITDFLLARIEEDEVAAATWHLADCERNTYDAGPCDCGLPSRAQAECDAKRRIVQKIQDTQLAAAYTIETFASSDSPRARVERAGYSQAAHATYPILEDLAAVYADHPDYDEAWSPHA